MTIVAGRRSAFLALTKGHRREIETEIPNVEGSSPRWSAEARPILDHGSRHDEKPSIVGPDPAPSAFKKAFLSKESEGELFEERSGAVRLEAKRLLHPRREPRFEMTRVSEDNLLLVFTRGSPLLGTGRGQEGHEAVVETPSGDVGVEVCFVLGHLAVGGVETRIADLERVGTPRERRHDAEAADHRVAHPLI